MGVNIYLVRVEGDDVSEIDWLDSNRFAGDSDLYQDESLEWIYPSESIDAMGIVQRPKDWFAFGDWVSANVPVENRPRWHRAVSAMVLDKRLFLQFIG